MTDKEILLFCLMIGVPTALILLFYFSKKNQKKLENKGLTRKGEFWGCLWVVIAMILAFLGFGVINIINNLFKH